MTWIAKQSVPVRRVSTFAIAAIAVGSLVPLFGEGEDQPIDFTHNVVDAPAPVPGTIYGTTGPSLRPGQRICKTETQTSFNVDTDCENLGPANETSIAVNPTNADNLIGGANEYQLSINPGGQVAETLLSRAHVTFDGGKTWSEYPITFNSAYQATGDPAVAFDTTGRAYYATLGYRFVGPVNATSADVLVATSSDGGKTWTSTRVADGSGNEGSIGDGLDKEYIAAWGDGNAIVTFGDFQQLQKGVISSARIYSTVTHDGGKTWSRPQVISGDLDQAFASIPTVAADGRIFVAFLNTTDLQTGRDDYEIVEINPDTGGRTFGPVKVVTTIDGATDYPLAFGRQTYQDSVFRTWAAGNITADPTDSKHLAVVWSDMRNSVLPAPADPYVAKTNSDVIVSESFDSGRTWSAPVALPLSGDQFMPWGAFDFGGLLRIGFFDRQYDSANHMYGYSIATQSGVGSPTFSTVQATTMLSDPTTGDRWSARTVNPGFPRASAFIGDYSNIVIVPSRGVAASWTDMRKTVCFAGVCGHGADAYFAVVP